MDNSRKPPKLSTNEIFTAANSAINALKVNGLSACLFGSSACALYGTSRTPNDVDIVVLSDLDPERIKEMIVAARNADAEPDTPHVNANGNNATSSNNAHAGQPSAQTNGADTYANTSSRKKSKVKKAKREGFYLVRAKDRRNTWKVLWYNFPAISQIPTGAPATANGTPNGVAKSAISRRRRCKVDILIPNIVGALNIPRPPPHRLVFLQYKFSASRNSPRIQNSRDVNIKLPVLPILPLLLLKLQGWTDHRNATEERYQIKQFDDARDIDELLELVEDDSLARLSSVRPRSSGQWVPQWFIEEAQERVLNYVQHYPTTMSYWSEIGFKVI